MGAYDFKTLYEHFRHHIYMATYGRKANGEDHDPNVESEVANVAIECENCKCVLLDFDNPNYKGMGETSTEPEKDSKPAPSTKSCPKCGGSLTVAYKEHIDYPIENITEEGGIDIGESNDCYDSSMIHISCDKCDKYWYSLRDFWDDVKKKKPSRLRPRRNH